MKRQTKVILGILGISVLGGAWLSRDYLTREPKSLVGSPISPISESPISTPTPTSTTFPEPTVIPTSMPTTVTKPTSTATINPTATSTVAPIVTSTLTLEPTATPTQVIEPSVTPAPEFVLVGGNQYVIQRGDSLWKIAGKVYGNPFLWFVLYDSNFYIYQDPGLIHADNVLWIPFRIVERRD